MANKKYKDSAQKHFEFFEKNKNQNYLNSSDLHYLLCIFDARKEQLEKFRMQVAFSTPRPSTNLYKKEKNKFIQITDHYSNSTLSVIDKDIRIIDDLKKKLCNIFESRYIKD